MLDEISELYSIITTAQGKEKYGNQLSNNKSNSLDDIYYVFSQVKAFLLMTTWQSLIDPGFYPTFAYIPHPLPSQ